MKKQITMSLFLSLLIGSVLTGSLFAQVVVETTDVAELTPGQKAAGGTDGGTSAEVYQPMDFVDGTSKIGSVAIDTAIDFTLLTTFGRDDAGEPGFANYVDNSSIGISGYATAWTKLALGLTFTDTQDLQKQFVKFDYFNLDSFVLRQFGIINKATDATNPFSLLLRTGYRDFEIQGYAGGVSDVGETDINNAELPRSLHLSLRPAYSLGSGGFVALDLAFHPNLLGTKKGGDGVATIYDTDADSGKLIDEETGKYVTTSGGYGTSTAVVVAPLILTNLYGEMLSKRIKWEVYFSTANSDTDKKARIGGGMILGGGFVYRNLIPGLSAVVGFDTIFPRKNTSFVDPSSGKVLDVSSNGRTKLGLGIGYGETLTSAGRGFGGTGVRWDVGLSSAMKFGIKGDGGDQAVYTNPANAYANEGMDVAYVPTTLVLAGRFMYGMVGVALGFKINDVVGVFTDKSKDGRDFNSDSGYELSLVLDSSALTLYFGWVSQGGDINSNVEPASAIQATSYSDNAALPGNGAVFFRVISSM